MKRLVRERAFAILAIAIVVAACSSQQTTTASSTPSAAASTTAADDTCDGVGKNEAWPEVYRDKYAAGVVKALKQTLSVYDSAVESGAPEQIGTAAGALYSDVRTNLGMFKLRRLYGCYDPSVLTGLQNATDAFAPTLDNLACAGENMCGRTPAEVPGLVAQANRQQRIYIEAINVYAAQFGGEQIPQR
jgi:hypothetical protein